MNNSLKDEKDKSFEEMIKAYGKNIQFLIRSFSTKINAEDVEQEVYIKVWKNIANYNNQGKTWSWLKKITLNTCKDHVKSKQFNQSKNTDYDNDILLRVKDEKVIPEASVINSERHRKIISAIENLKPKFKEVIILFDMQDYTYEEIAEKLKCPLGTVKSRVFNARKALQAELQDLL